MNDLHYISKRMEEMKYNAVEVFFRFLEKYKSIENIPSEDTRKILEILDFLDFENEKILNEAGKFKKNLN